MSPRWTLILLALLHLTVVEIGAASTNWGRSSDNSQSQSGSSTNSLAELPYESVRLTGVAYLNGNIYATSKRSNNNTIIAYDGSSWAFTRLSGIVVDGLKIANDLAADPDRNLLFVADYSMRIWKVDVATSKSSQLIQTSFSPSALWFNQKTNQLVVVGEGTSQLFVYSADGGDVQTVVTLPRDIDLKHAVATDYGTYLVAHTARSALDSTRDNVTEFDVNGKVLRSFGGRRGSATGQLNTPCYLALKADGGVLVADWINGRIVRLNSQLQFNGYAAEGVPVTRLCLVEQRGLLFAGLTKNIAIFKP